MYQTLIISDLNLLNYYDSDGMAIKINIYFTYNTIKEEDLKRDNFAHIMWSGYEVMTTSAPC